MRTEFSHGVIAAKYDTSLMFADLRLTRLDVIHAADQTFPLAPRVRAVALSRVLDDVAPLR